MKIIIDISTYITVTNIEITFQNDHKNVFYCYYYSIIRGTN
jgi:hypothetical protein